MSTESKRRELPWTHDDPPPTLHWRCWPLRDRWLGTAIVLAFLAALGLGVWLVTSEVRLALLAVSVMAAALWRFFLPVSFELNPEGVNQWVFGRRRQIRWVSIHRYEVCSAGVLLLPFADRAAMDALRGLYLPWGNHRDEVLFQVQYYLDQPL